MALDVPWYALIQSLLCFWRALSQGSLSTPLRSCLVIFLVSLSFFLIQMRHLTVRALGKTILTKARHKLESDKALESIKRSVGGIRQSGSCRQCREYLTPTCSRCQNYPAISTFQVTAAVEARDLSIEIDACGKILTVNGMVIRCLCLICPSSSSPSVRTQSLHGLVV